MATSDYILHPDGRFEIRDYNRKKPFCNFLPGIAGLYGIPMWVFYVNRGQAISSFGTRNKDNAILEFFPANKAFQTVTTLGFRTFIKRVHGESAHAANLHPKGVSCYEAFRENLSLPPGWVTQSMEMNSHELVLKETNRALGLEISVLYFTVPGEPLAALAREITFTNISGRRMDLEILDGLPFVNPYGMNEFFIKHMSRTIEAWMTVENVREGKAPFFRLKVDATDRPEVIPIEGGNFYFSVGKGPGSPARLLDPLVDPSCIFGSLLDFSQPKLFYGSSPFRVSSKQILENQSPCAFSFVSLRLAKGESHAIRSFFGHARTLEGLNRYVSSAKRPDYLDKKRTENKRLVEGLKAPCFSATASPAYDLYCGQTYLDNLLRGGCPVGLDGRGRGGVVYVYSRKHGDLERDYNRFLVEPTYFSQGDGNYRDVNQNRRHDGWFYPEVRDTNVKTFLNLIQLDGFNPLVVKGSFFHLKRSPGLKRTLDKFITKEHRKAAQEFLSRSFGMGELCEFLERRGIMDVRSSFGRFATALAPFLAEEGRAEHGEGFWVDHWTYNLDLLESFLAIFPEEKERVLFQDSSHTFYDNDHRVRKREERYRLLRKGVVRQYQSVFRDPEKTKLLEAREGNRFAVRTGKGGGAIYRTTLFVKLLCLFANKLASIDPCGAGIEMEADKPSWYDALNGLPGLLGSSLPEVFELKRLALFLIQAMEDLGMDLAGEVKAPVELCAFLRELHGCLQRHLKDKSSTKDFIFWDRASGAKETFREKTRFGLWGKEKVLSLREIRLFLEHAREKIDISLEKAYDPRTGLFPTYFENRVARYRAVKARRPGHRPVMTIRPVQFEQRALPFFLEGPVHALKVEKDPARRRALLKAIRESGLYDSRLGMYKVNAPFGNLSLEVGRACVFAPGWLENETIWLHMEHKLLLEILRGGMAEEFFKDFKRALIPFQPAERYGRSILENSSFIVSSAFADPSLHGTGFVARLSGSTAEFLQCWLYMNVGRRPFTLGPDGKLSLRFEPQLPAFLFVKEDTERVFYNQEGETVKVRVPKNSLAFMFLGKTLVFYHNPRRLDTFGNNRVSVKKVTLTQNRRGGVMEFKGDTIPSPYAARVRDEWAPRIDIELA